MCELKRTLDNEMKLQEFLGVKGQFREMADLNAKKEAERQARREEKQNKIAAFTQILQTIKQFTGASFFFFMSKCYLSVTFAIRVNYMYTIFYLLTFYLRIFKTCINYIFKRQQFCFF